MKRKYFQNRDSRPQSALRLTTRTAGHDGPCFTGTINMQQKNMEASDPVCTEMKNSSTRPSSSPFKPVIIPHNISG